MKRDIAAEAGAGGEDARQGREAEPEPIGPDAKIGRMEEDLRHRVAEIEALQDRILRLQAEFENYKKRVARERSDFMKFATEGLLLEFLPILDNLERALATARSGANPQAVAEGLEIILRLFQSTLEKAGVQAIGVLGREFDPNLHQAVAPVESVDGRDNVVVEEVLKGYLLEGRVLRPSMVKVSKVTAVPSEPAETDRGDDPGNPDR
jgi:molecular chaperone GrpE